MKKYLFLIILSLLSKLSESIEELTENNSFSKLISMVRMEIINKSLQDLPRKKEANFLQMVNKMVSAKKEYSLNETESAFLVFKWICQNINLEQAILDDPINAYNSGKGSSKALSSLFNYFCSYLKVSSNSISGYLKYNNFYYNELQKKINHTWNYVEIKGKYYLLDVSMASKLRIYSDDDILYFYFGTDPEILIRSHFPNENKWQLLSEPYPFEKFENMALLYPYFYLFGFKTISPDTNKIIGNENIIITSDKLFLQSDYFTICKIKESKNIMSSFIFSSPFPSKEIKISYNENENECLIYEIHMMSNSTNHLAPIVSYNTKYTK